MGCKNRLVTQRTIRPCESRHLQPEAFLGRPFLFRTFSPKPIRMIKVKVTKTTLNNFLFEKRFSLQ